MCSSGILSLLQTIWKYRPAGMPGLHEDSNGEMDAELLLELLKRPDPSERADPHWALNMAA